MLGITIRYSAVHGRSVKTQDGFEVDRDGLTRGQDHTLRRRIVALTEAAGVAVPKHKRSS